MGSATKSPPQRDWIRLADRSRIEATPSFNSWARTRRRSSGAVYGVTGSFEIWMPNSFSFYSSYERQNKTFHSKHKEIITHCFLKQGAELEINKTRSSTLNIHFKLITWLKFVWCVQVVTYMIFQNVSIKFWDNVLSFGVKNL